MKWVVAFCRCSTLPIPKTEWWPLNGESQTTGKRLFSWLHHSTKSTLFLAIICRLLKGWNRPVQTLYYLEHVRVSLICVTTGLFLVEVAFDSLMYLVCFCLQTLWTRSLSCRSQEAEAQSRFFSKLFFLVVVQIMLPVWPFIQLSCWLR